ncbi:isocitrate lyase/PEP mutase family protein [Streptomyces sp. NBC_00385]|uniref:isocitrate lyase/PEP mutase family protein n=1 Tax=Streptomyces sp. NBC_00385 TaxID=2975733 RepID=UPI002DDB24F2|nr:isocitrate lyase/phosphoenolpyruvate mutase family protein [Streptomyces sp. NBC_00385]WRZ08746.1 isocitrate lyase/phosphoenolpyruvate mutase family protein [Streptomyces sp. NBC_00385]
MTHTTHEFDRFEDVRSALADPALVPERPAAADGPPGASVAWLRATVARFSHGEPHRRRRGLVEAELARLAPESLRQAAAVVSGDDTRVAVVRTLAVALGMPQPAAVAQAVIAVAGVYFGGEDAAADEAVARLVRWPATPSQDGTGSPQDGPGCPSHVPGSVQGGPGTPSAGSERTTSAGSERTTSAGSEPTTEPVPVPDDAALESAASRIGLLVQACEATAALVETAAGNDRLPLSRVLRDLPPVRSMRRVAVGATRVAGREIAEGDVVLLDLATANRAHPVPLTFGAPPRVCPGRAHALALADGLLRRPITPFARLHRRAQPLLLPNAWDYASAAALAERGFAAVGTTSLGVAAAAGVPDGAAATAEATMSLARRLGKGRFLFTVDAEGGFSDDVAEVAALARTLYEAGAAGINLEDGRPDGTLAPMELHAAKIAAVKHVAPALFVNARTDTHWASRHEDETATRLALYEQSGADGVFVPGLSDPAAIAELASALVVPLNILYTPAGPTLAELASLGVRRVSLGSLLYRRALAAAVSAATGIRDGRQTDPAAPSYAEVQELAYARQARDPAAAP